VDIPTVTAHSLEWHENPGHLSKQTIDESRIAPENRVPRVTSATWKYESGAVGSFIHVVALQGHDYSCELEVYADGYQFKYVLFPLTRSLAVLTFCPPRDRLVNPYVQPVLYIRRPGSDLEETHRFPDDDPFFSEVSNLIDVVEDIEEDPEHAIILSSYEGAWIYIPPSLVVTQVHARNGQTRARRMISLGLSAGPVRSRARMSEHETSVVVRTWMSNKPGSVGRGNKKSDRRGWRL
jgi:hypothetical protein